MLTSGDLIHLPFTSDLTQAGVDYTCRLFTHTGASLAATPLQWQSAVSDKAAELAFRRLLGELDVPYASTWSTPFSDPDRSYITLGGHRCELSCNHIWDKEAIRRLRRDSASLLEFFPFAVSDRAIREQRKGDDLIVFAVTTAIVARSRQDIQRALAGHHPAYLIHALPESWANPGGWTSFRPLSLESEASSPVLVELAGRGPDRAYQSEQVLLQPRSRIQAGQDFFALSMVHINHPPDGRIGLSTPRLRRAYRISKDRWQNIWVYGFDIILAGYLPYWELRRQAIEGTSDKTRHRAGPASCRPGKGMLVPIESARPLGDLFRRVKNWAAREIQE